MKVAFSGESETAMGDVELAVAAARGALCQVLAVPEDGLAGFVIVVAAVRGSMLAVTTLGPPVRDDGVAGAMLQTLNNTLARSVSGEDGGDADAGAVH
jgi:hypothetical protein